MIPKFEQFLFPVLSFLKDGKEHKVSSLCQQSADYFQLTADDMEQRIAGGKQQRYYNRVQWTTTYLLKAGLLEKPKHGVCVITKEGKALLKSGVTNLSRKYLIEHYPAFSAFATGGKHGQGTDVNEEIDKTPQEEMEVNYELINNQLADDLLGAIMDKSPEFFEHLVVDLLVNMGYGGGERAYVTSFVKDGGIDGVINEDSLGLDKIYIQAKRYASDHIVGRPEIQSFVGALSGKGSKGVFITTSSFSKEAREYQPGNNIKIVLIDGHRLCRLMIEYDLGVSPIKTYLLKRLDTDFFEN